MCAAARRIALAWLMAFLCASATQSKPLNYPGPPIDARIWTDATKKFRIEAQLLKVVDGIAHLKRKDNAKVVEVSLANLSLDDIAFVRALADPAPGVPRLTIFSADKLESTAKRQRTAREALAMYGMFLSDAGVPDAEKEKAKERHAYWQTAAEQKLLRLGAKWLTQEQIHELEATENRLFNEALRLYEAESYELAAKRFGEASKAQPESIRSDFRMGLLAALIDRDAGKASEYFDTCVKRRMARREQLNTTELANLCAALNNLALTELRQRKYAQALGHWTQALELAPPSPELVQNLGRLGHLSSRGVRADLGAKATLNLGPTERNRWEALYTKAMKAVTGEVFDRQTGWLYMADVREQPSQPVAVKSKDSFAKMRVIGYGTGFVVAPGYVMTNAHVAEDGHGFYLVERDRPQVRLSAVAKAVSKQSDLDLAVLRCDGLRAPPIAFAPQLPKLGGEIRLIGFPLPDALGTSLKATRGAISGVPPHSGMQGSLADYKDYLLYDAIINPGNSGGPACDARGGVVAVNTAILMPYAPGGGYAAGVPAHRALDFLAQHVKDARPLSTKSDAPQLAWDQAVDRVGAATVQVMILQDPAQVSLGDRFADARRRKKEWDACEDPWCMACHGSGKCDCPERSCKQGKVLEHRTETVRFPDGSGVTKQVPVRVPCPICRGQGKVRCGYCTSGIDPIFFADDDD